MLIEIEFYSRYGDLLAGPCKKLRLASEAAKTKGWFLLSNAYWTEIAAKLKHEADAYKDYLNGYGGSEN